MRVLICIDKSLSTERILMTAKTFVDNFINKSEVKVIHILDDALVKDAEGFADMVINELKEESIELKKLAENIIGKEIQYIEDRGNPSEKISELLKKLEYDILIMGSHGRTGLKHLLMGSFTQHIIKNSNKPTLVIPVHSGI